MSGRVACWGSNSRGQLGDGTTTNAAEPTLVVGITDAAAVTAGDGFTCARRTGGTVSCWGGNWAGMLGLPTSVPRSSTPRAVSGLSGVVEVSAGTAHACARLTGGAVRCWGDATSGFCGRPGCRLGDGGGTAAGSLSTVAGLADAAQLAAADGSTCARRAGGSVVCWGDNGSGQLGDGTTTSRTTPRTVVGLTDAAALAAGARHVCAARSGGTVVCWGDNARGQLGDGTTTSRSTPGPVIALGAAVTLLRAGGAVSAARLSDGRLLMWGGNVSSSFGPAVPPADHSTPVPSTIPTPLSRLAPADALTCGTFADGRAFCYGDDSSGQRGDGADDDNIVNL
jgi:alpha-tubulin suppressor-like RCC1 family protein